MKTSSLSPIAALLLAFTMSNAQESPLPPELRKQISEWRMNTLPTLDAETYWAGLKELGSKVGEANAIRIELLGSSDAESAIALMAYKAGSQPDKVDEIAAWYGRTVDKIDEEQWHSVRERLAAKGLSERELQIALSSGWSPQMRSAPPAMKLIHEIHGMEDYLHTWEAWMLSPYSIERRTMRKRMSEALSQIGNEQTISILVEKYRILPQQYPEGGRLDDRRKHIHDQLSEIRRIISEIGGKSAVCALLECVRIAEAQGDLGEGADNVRKITVHALSRTLGREYIEEMEAQFPDFHKTYGVPGRPGEYLPVDDKWKEFKPIIEAMLKDPKDLRAEDIRLLQDALAAMPKN